VQVRLYEHQGELRPGAQEGLSARKNATLRKAASVTVAQAVGPAPQTIEARSAAPAASGEPGKSWKPADSLPSSLPKAEEVTRHGELRSLSTARNPQSENSATVNYCRAHCCSH